MTQRLTHSCQECVIATLLSGLRVVYEPHQCSATTEQAHMTWLHFSFLGVFWCYWYQYCYYYYWYYDYYDIICNANSNKRLMNMNLKIKKNWLIGEIGKTNNQLLGNQILYWNYSGHAIPVKIKYMLWRSRTEIYFVVKLLFCYLLLLLKFFSIMLQVSLTTVSQFTFKFCRQCTRF